MLWRSKGELLEQLKFGTSPQFNNNNKVTHNCCYKPKHLLHQKSSTSSTLTFRRNLHCWPTSPFQSLFQAGRGQEAQDNASQEQCFWTEMCSEPLRGAGRGCLLKIQIPRSHCLPHRRFSFRWDGSWRTSPSTEAGCLGPVGGGRGTTTPYFIAQQTGSMPRCLLLWKSPELCPCWFLGLKVEFRKIFVV